MAACDLTIILDNPTETRVGGETITGQVKVVAKESTKCKGLELVSGWRTHGHGNIASGEAEKVQLFTGTWDATTEYSYPFRLKTAEWPPTYYGNYLNVSHFLSARAKLSWKTDPKAEVEYRVISSNSPDDLKPTDNRTKGGASIVGWIIGGILLLIFSLFIPIMLIILVPLALIGGGFYWFFRIFLPKQILGTVECSVQPLRVAAGQSLNGQVRFSPKRNSSINGILWSVVCEEKCSSGSGSNRKSHRHEVYSKKVELSPALALQAGTSQSHDFTFAIPDEAAPSIKLSDNELNWYGEFRIDIPSWPDWVKRFPLTIIPSANSGESAWSQTSFSGAGDDESVFDSEEPINEDDAWFQQMLEQVDQSRGNSDRLQTVLEALQDQVFTIRVDIGESMSDAPSVAVGETGKWRVATHPKIEDEICLLWPTSLVAPPTFTGNYSAPARVIGYDQQLESLVMRIEPPTVER